MIRTPATDKKWFDDVMVELRLRQVHGSAIGDTVASARELLADTGQSAEEAFGPARVYAASLELPHAPAGQWVRAALWPMLASLLAFLLFAQAATAWAGEELLLVSPAQVALVGTPVVLAAVGGVLIIGSVLASPETRGIDLAGNSMVGATARKRPQATPAS